jgi:hypothetical protein
MTPIDDEALSQDGKVSAFRRELSGSALSLAAALLGVCVVYIAVLDWRFPYIHQLPVFDLDYITSVTMGWARNWWIEGPWHMLFAMPYAPRASCAGRQSSGSRLRFWRPASCCSRADRCFSFPKVYTFDTHIVVFYALLVFAATLEVAAARRTAATWCYVAELAILVSGLFVDWLFYFVYAVWFVLRWYGSRKGYRRRMGRNETVALLLLPLATFATFLAWRVVTPGSIARQEGLVASFQELVWKLVWKLVFRLGDTDDHPVSFRDFFAPFYQSHQTFYWSGAPVLILTGFIACIALFGILFAVSRADPTRQKIYFGLLSVLLVSIIPAYAQMIVFKQHTTIHPWAIAKVVVPLAMVPGVFLPLLAVSALEQWNAGGKLRSGTALRVVSSLGVLAFAVWLGTSACRIASLT